MLILIAFCLSLLPAAVLAQEPTPDVIAASEPPTLMVSADVTSYSVPSPGLFWQTAASCPPRPPSVTGGESLPPESAPAAATSPDAVNAATDFTVRRKTVRGDETRTIFRRVDPTPPTQPPWVCANYAIRSNIVADAVFVYWVDATGLVRLPATANPADTPQLVDGGLSGSEPVELVDGGDRVFAMQNVPGSQFVLARSRVTEYIKATGVINNRKSYFYNAGLNSLSWDGSYLYYREGGTNDLIRLDGAGNVAAIAFNVGTHFSEGLRTTCPTISCIQTHYVFYAQTNVIKRYNNLNGQTETIQTRSGRILDLLASRSGFFLGVGNSLFWFEGLTAACGLLVCPTTYTLYRAGRGVNATAEVLYFYIDNPVGYGRVPADMVSDGTWLFWKEGVPFAANLFRLPNNVDALPKVDMAITGYEATQAVQRDDNSVRLVQGRNTYVRVFVQATGSNVAGATMRLYGRWNGFERGPLLPLEAIHLTAKTAPNRNTMGDSFLFQLPLEWSLQPNISLRAVLNPFQVPPEPTYGNNQFTAAVNFSPAFPLRVILYEATYRISTGGNTFQEYRVPDSFASIDWIRRAYPIAEDGLNYNIYSINGGAILGNRVNQSDKVCQDMPASLRSLCASDWVMAKISEMAANPNFAIPANAYLYGLILDSQTIGGAFPRGQAGGRVGAGPTGTSITVNGYSDYGYYTGHELAHELGRPHPSPNSDDPATDVDNMGNPIIEGCGHSRSDNSYPYALARIGPGNGTLRGFDRSGNRTGGYLRPAVLDDVNSFDMMSYCGNSQIRWPSDYTWERMYLRLQSDAQAAAAGQVGPFGGEQVGVFGSVYGSAVVVQNVARMTGSLTPPPSGPGDFTLRQLNAANAVLSATQFQPEKESDAARPFAVVVPLASGARRLQIVATAGGPVLFDKVISANLPVVSSVTLPGAPSPVTGPVTVAWTASDPDGDPLTFDIFYSFDDGATFQPALLGATGSSAVVDTAALGGGTGRFRVVASDGVNQGAAESAPFQMAVKAPRVHISSPANGAVYNWGQLVKLSGDSYDTLDGLLPGGSMSWSNQYGALGSGTVLDVTELPVGQNVLTLTAQNSAGLSASKMVTITVGDVLSLPGPLLQATPFSLGFHLPASGATTDVRTVSLTNGGASSTIAWSVSSSAPWLTANPTSADNVPATLQVTANRSGLASGATYEALLTVTGTPTGGTPQVVVIPVEMTVGNPLVNNFTAPPAGLNQRLFLPSVFGQ